MPKEFDVYLNQALESDIILRKSLTECDIMVHSIPFRDGITVVNRLILESCLNYYILQKFVAVQNGSSLVSHIDKMIKTCYERLSYTIEPNIDASFDVLYAIHPQQNNMILSAENIETISNMFTSAQNQIVMSVSPLFIDAAKSVGKCNNSITLNAFVLDNLKRSFETFYSTEELNQSIITINTEKKIDAQNTIQMSQSLQSLCYQLMFVGHTAMEISAIVLGTSIRFSFGHGSSGIGIGSYITGTTSQKFETVQVISNIVAQVIHNTLFSFMNPEHHTVSIGSSATSTIRRYRLLRELDNSILSTIDDISLDDLSYITLDG